LEPCKDLSSYPPASTLLYNFPPIAFTPPGDVFITESQEDVQLIEILDWMREQDQEVEENDYAEISYQKWKGDEDDDSEILAEEASLFLQILTYVGRNCCKFTTATSRNGGTNHVTARMPRNTVSELVS
jgi:hypothetical protein